MIDPAALAARYLATWNETDPARLSLLSTTTVFGTPVDITLSELALEAFFPADPETAALLHRLASPRMPGEPDPGETDP